jgi:hypothetical protein
MHLAATLMSAERDRTIKASFFLDTKKCPKTIGVGDKVLLFGVQLQIWRGYLQLSGKNFHVESVKTDHP